MTGSLVKECPNSKALTAYERSRFIRRRFCINCGAPIYDDEPFIMHKRRFGYRVFYSFAHLQSNNVCDERRTIMNG